MALATTNLSLNQLVQSFAALANAHGQIHSFGQGFEDEFISTTVENYPLFWVSLLPSTFTGNTIDFNFRFILMDLIDADKKNLLDIHSDTLQILWDIIKTIEYTYDLSITLNGQATPFEESYRDDRVAGHYVDITISVARDFGECNAPINCE